MERLRDVLMGREGNSIMPFFWQHGEAQGTLEEYMERIRECGCGGVCVEARPHPEFGKDRWWEDVAKACAKSAEPVFPAPPQAPLYRSDYTIGFEPVQSIALTFSHGYFIIKTQLIIGQKNKEGMFA